MNSRKAVHPRSGNGPEGRCCDQGERGPGENPPQTNVSRRETCKCALQERDCRGVLGTGYHIGDFETRGEEGEVVVSPCLSWRHLRKALLFIKNVELACVDCRYNSFLSPLVCEMKLWLERMESLLNSWVLPLFNSFLSPLILLSQKYKALFLGPCGG